MLGAQHRLGKSDALTQVIRRGKMTRTRGFSLRTMQTRYPVSRFAVSISHKANKYATQRNRVRRQLIGLLMSRMDLVQPGYDCAIGVFKEAFDMTATERRNHFLSLLKKAQLVSTT